MEIKIKKVNNIRFIDNYKPYRLYVFKTKNSYVVSDMSNLSLVSMVKIKGEYHFGTLKELRMALNKNKSTK